MAIINRVESGLIFEDNFSDPSLSSNWLMSPSDTSRYSTTEISGYLRLKHGDPDIYALLPMPDGDFVFEIANNYFPTIESDMGGIVAYQGESQKVELLEYFDKNYTHMRIKRSQGRYEGYGSSDGGNTWKLIGSGVSPGLTMIGVELQGKNNVNSVNLDIDYVRIMRDNKIIVGNLLPNWKVILRNFNNQILSQTTVPQGKKVTYLNVNTLSIYGTVEIYDSLGQLIGKTALDHLWGGDVFSYDLDLSFSIDDIVLRQDISLDLGEMVQNFIEKRVIVTNNEDYILNNVHIGIYQLLAREGYQLADVSLDDLGMPFSYGDNIIIESIGPTQEVTFWLKISREDYVPSMQDYAFKIVVTPGV